MIALEKWSAYGGKNKRKPKRSFVRRNIANAERPVLGLRRELDRIEARANDTSLPASDCR